MNRITTLTLAAAALMAGCAQGPLPMVHMPPSQESIAAHVAAATTAAGADLTALLPLCKAPAATQPSHEDIDKGIAGQIARERPEPGKAFDNLYFVGAAWVSAWAIRTSDGIILIDGLNNQEEAAQQIEGGMRKLGLDPAQIKTIIVTHGHGDHYGGVPYLAGKYGAKVVMSDADWTMTETKLEFESSLWASPPKRDIAAKDGDKVTLGDTTVSLYLTPGHTMGTLSPVFDVSAAGVPHRVMLWGGTSFNFGNNPPRLDSYVQATERMKRLVLDQKIDVLISNHSGFDGSLGKLDSLHKQSGPQPNPFVMDTKGVDRALTVMGECAMATRDRYLVTK
jgi:metallo-beta-lactamase class B